MDCFLDSGHGGICCGLVNIDQEASLGLVVYLERRPASLIGAGAAAFAGIEMVLARLARHDLAVFGDLEALEE